MNVCITLIDLVNILTRGHCRQRGKQIKEIKGTMKELKRSILMGNFHFSVCLRSCDDYL